MRPAVAYTLMYFGVLALYGLTLSANLTVAMDAPFFLLNIVQDEPAFNPHHLLYEPVAWLFLKAVTAVLGPVDPLKVVSFIGAIFGAGCVAAVFAVFHRRGQMKLSSAALCALPVAFSFGLWYYSVTVEVYVIGIFFMLMAFLVLTAEQISTRGWFLVGVFAGAAVLSHQVFPLFGAVILVRLWMIDDTWSAKLTAAWVCIAPAALIVLVPYVLVMTVSDTVPDGQALQWLLGYAATNPEFVHVVGPESILKAAMGFSRSIFGGFFLFAVPELNALVSSLPGETVADDAFLAAAAGPFSARVIALLTLVFAALVLFLIVLSVRRWRELERPQRLPTILALVWLFTFAAFFVVWQPHNPELWIAQTVCFWMALFIPLGDRVGMRPIREVRPARVVMAVAALLLAITWFGSIRFTQTIERDYYRWRLAPIEQQAQPGDLALVAAPWPARHVVELFTGITAIDVNGLRFDDTHLGKIQETLDQDRRVYLVFPVVESDRPSVLTPLAANLAPMRLSIIENPELGLAIVSRGIE